VARQACVGRVQHWVGVADEPRRVVRTCREVAVVEEGFVDLALGSCCPGVEDAVPRLARQGAVDVADVEEVFVAVACFGRGC